MVLAGCDNLAGSGSGNNEAAFAETTATESAGGTIAGSTELSDSALKKIRVKFEVKNGGFGLLSSEGIISTQDDDSYIVYDKASCASDYTITVRVPASDEYLNVRWRGDDFMISDNTYVKAKMKPKSGIITLDYNGYGRVATKNLYDVEVSGDFDIYNNQTWIAADWKAAEKRAVKN